MPQGDWASWETGAWELSRNSSTLTRSPSLEGPTQTVLLKTLQQGYQLLLLSSQTRFLKNQENVTGKRVKGRKTL